MDQWAHTRADARRRGFAQNAFVSVAVGVSVLVTSCSGPTESRVEAPAVSQAPPPLSGALPESSSGYYGVYTAGNVVLFGKLVSATEDWVTLTDVHYIRSAVNPESKQMANQLVKRAREWHQPSESAINRQNILVIEPVAQDSRMMSLIREPGNASAADPIN